MSDKTLKGLYKFCEEKSKNIKLKAEPQVFVELCNALEELKYLHTTKETMYREIYNKAIDDFVKEICKMIVRSESNGNYRFYAVEIKQLIAYLAEQLKAGK